MAHKIDGMPPQGLPSVGKSPTATSSAGNDKPVSPVSEATPVSLSSEARQMQALHDKVSVAPDMDMQRVEAVKAAIAKGQFQIDAKAVAQGLLGMERALEA